MNVEMDQRTPISRESVICSCLNCKSILGSFENAWEGIGKTYMSPLVTFNTDGLKPVGPVRPGAPKTMIEHSSLRDLACQNCDKIVGLCCVKAPEGHTLRTHQNILRLKLMSVVSDESGEKAVIAPPVRSSPLQVEERSLPPSLSQSMSSNKGNLLSSPVTTNQVNGVHPLNIALISPPADSDLPSQRSAASFQKVLGNQKADIARIENAVERIETEMQSLRNLMSECRKELDTLRQSQLAQTVENERARTLDADNAQGRPMEAPAELSVDEFTMLTGDIMKVSQKANEIDGFKMEVKFLKARLQRLEDGSREKSAALSSQIRVTETPILENTMNSSRIQRSQSMVQLSSILASEEEPDDRMKPTYAQTERGQTSYFQGSGERRSSTDAEVPAEVQDAEDNEVRTPQNRKSTRKRNHDQMDDPHQINTYKPAQQTSKPKRGRLSGILLSEESSAIRHSTPQQYVHFSSPEIKSPEIISSETHRSPSPILGRYDENGQVKPRTNDNDFDLQMDHMPPEEEVALLPQNPTKSMAPPKTPNVRLNASSAFEKAGQWPHSDPEKLRPRVPIAVTTKSARRSLCGRKSLGDLETATNIKHSNELVRAESEFQCDDDDLSIDPSELTYKVGEKRGGYYGSDGRRRTKEGLLWGVWTKRKPGSGIGVSARGKEGFGEESRKLDSLGDGDGDGDAVLPSIESDGEEEEARRSLLAAREQLVRATLEREHMGVL